MCSCPASVLPYDSIDLIQIAIPFRTGGIQTRYGDFKYMTLFEVYHLLIYIAPVNAMPLLIYGDLATTLRGQGGDAMHRPFNFNNKKFTY